VTLRADYIREMTKLVHGVVEYYLEAFGANPPSTPS
jgi:hypothetical protein